MNNFEMDAGFTRKVLQSQRRSFLASALLTIVLAAAIGGFLFYSLNRLNYLQAQVSDKASELERLNRMLSAQKTQIAALKEEISKGTSFADQLRPLGYEDVKSIGLEHEKSSRLLLTIVQNHGVRWGTKNTLADGFTSAGYARYILGRVDPSAPDIRELPARVGPPHSGDLVRYVSGYAMFYFAGSRYRSEARETGFVAGMTPFGVASLPLEFGPKIVEVRKTPWSE